MTAGERGFLLLTSHLGDPARKVLTAAQLRKLAARVKVAEGAVQKRDMIPEDLVALGYGRETAERILYLLSQEEQLDWYLRKGALADCYPLTRVSTGYPLRLRKRLGEDSPGCLWAKGDVSVLDKPAVALVGSRDLDTFNTGFAREAGKQAALQGITLVSGNARGADREAQEACLAYGGSVISVVADSLEMHPLRKNVLYLSEESYDCTFSAQRALSRNRVIHCLGEAVLVAQCTYGSGGTWDGTIKNLRNRWSPVFCFHDGSRGVQELLNLGGQPIGLWELQDLSVLNWEIKSLFDP